MFTDEVAPSFNKNGVSEYAAMISTPQVLDDPQIVNKVKQ